MGACRNGKDTQRNATVAHPRATPNKRKCGQLLAAGVAGLVRFVAGGVACLQGKRSFLTSLETTLDFFELAPFRAKNRNFSLLFYSSWSRALAFFSGAFFPLRLSLSVVVSLPAPPPR